MIIILYDNRYKFSGVSINYSVQYSIANSTIDRTVIILFHRKTYLECFLNLKSASLL